MSIIVGGLVIIGGLGLATYYYLTKKDEPKFDTYPDKYPSDDSSDESSEESSDYRSTISNLESAIEDAKTALNTKTYYL